MSYTNLEIVKKYLNISDIPSGEYNDYPVTFSGLDEISLPGNNIISGSLKVKAVKDLQPQYERKNVGGEPITLACTRIVPGSVMIASDNSLTTTYKENADYSVDCKNGTIERIDGGGIQSGSDISVWYYYYALFTEDVDFAADYKNGAVKRLAGGSILSGQTVLVDYLLSNSQINEDAYLAAVAHANAVIEKEVDPEGQFGADPALQTAATFLAVSFVCRMEAVADMSQQGEGGNTDSWLAIAESYRNDYTALIKIFRPRAADLKHPRLT